MIPLEEIRAASNRLSGRVHRTPLMTCRTIGRRLRTDLLLKCENFQKTGSFKARGALNKVLSLTKDERARGLVTVSAGNHAQAVAWAAAQAGASCAVVMPADAPRSKMDAVRGYGAEVIEHGDRDTLFDRLDEVREARGATFVHPFDDPVLLAGAGTAGLEIMEDAGDVDVVVVPVGGGGLMGGVTSAVKAINPQARVIAVELEAGPGLAPALEAGKPIPVKRPYDTLADGMTPPFVGALPMQIARDHVDVIVTVNERAIIEAMQLLFTRAKLYVEGSGAATVGALLSGRVPLREGDRVVAFVSGGNVDPERVFSLFETQSAREVPS